MIAVAEAAPEDKRPRVMIEDYLSAKHLNTPGTGCPLAALAPEIARQPLEIRKRINQSMLALRERLLPYIPGHTVEEKRAHFFDLLPGMAGVLVTARAIADRHGRERMLAAARSFYLEAFG
jgi:TetR/AcrR family transcriptional regulator, transcriptional repressor for nem operon